MKKYIIFIFLIFCSFNHIYAVQDEDFCISFINKDMKRNMKNSDSPVREMSSDGKTVTIKLSIKNGFVTQETFSNKKYSIVDIQGLNRQTEPGSPQLPSLIETLSVTTLKPVIKIQKAEYVEYNKIDIAPSQKPIPETVEQIQDSIFYKNPVIYEKDEFYPRNIVEVIQSQKYKSGTIAYIKINPVQYNPVRRTIRCYSDIHITSNHIIAEPSADLSDIMSLSVNAPVRSTTLPTISNIREKYIIVTINRYRDCLTEFCAWKDSLGYKVDLISKSTWNNVNEVRDSILAHYCTPNDTAKYLFIIGTANDVPSTIVNYSPVDGKYGYTTDHFLASINEGIMEELLRGRIPVRNETELITILRKTIDYEKNPIFYNHAAHVAYFEAAEGSRIKDKSTFIKTSEIIRTSALENSKYETIDRLYFAEDSVTPTYYSDNTLLPLELRTPSMWNADCHNIAQTFNSGIDYILYRSHGNFRSWLRPYYNKNAHFHLMGNQPKTPVLFSLTCSTGRYETVNSSNQTDDIESFAHKMLSMNSSAGSVAVVAAVDTTWTIENDVFSKGIFNALLPQSSLRDLCGNPAYLPVIAKEENILGKLVQRGFQSLTTYSNFTNETIKRYHIFGDPSIQVYTEIPSDLSICEVFQINDSIVIDTHGINDCTIILQPKDNQIFYKRIENLTGRYAFQNASTDYNIIISKKNCKTRWISSPLNLFLQNQEIHETKNYIAKHTQIGSNVTNQTANGNYIIKSGGNLKIKSNQIKISSGFRCEQGGKFQVILP